MPRFDPAHRAAELRALIEQVAASANRLDGGDHPMRGRVRFCAGAYKLQHLGVTGTSTMSPAEAMRAWCRQAHRRADSLERPAPRLPQAVRS